MNTSHLTRHSFIEFPEWEEDKALMEVLRDCIDVQWSAGKSQIEKFVRREDCDQAVSAEALEEILGQKQDVSDIRTSPELSNCIVFHTTHLSGSLIDERVLQKRKLADEMICSRIERLFGPEAPVQIEVSGHFWYPDGGFMGWHTNLRKPGWRMYVNYAVEEHKSFFRYRAPETGEIVTAWDKHWNFRMFEIATERPFWHCVRSWTDRFSLGYKINLI